MHKLIYTALFTMGVFAIVAAPAFAQTTEQYQKQKAEQEIEFECDPGVHTVTRDSYGKITDEDYKDGKCKFEGSQSLEQEQYQKILGYSEDQKVHYPVDTAVDGTTMAVATGLAAIGGLSYAAKRKLA